MKTVLLDVSAGIAKVVDVEPKLEAYYKLLHCRCIDIVERRIGGRWFDVMCDDEGLLQSEPIVSAFDYLGRARLVGSLMFFHHDDEGNLWAFQMMTFFISVLIFDGCPAPCIRLAFTWPSDFVNAKEVL